eukprot:TRINITY_DN3219_c0_g3_i1.p1 TRINITY_DN3219_c0_g3~~TRINITY_DN3219_c0_g3_i1.p1  ORF type:complete len:185 (-),score=13.88 TRINITY_DN3219_c0_g3_i1:16-570(-)
MWPVWYFVFSCMSCALTYRGEIKLFSFHPFLTIFAICFFMPTALWFERRKFPRKHWFHVIFHITAFLLNAIALYVIWQNKENKKKIHLKTWHAWIGTAFSVLYSIQVLTSLPWMWPGKKPSERAEHRDNHKLFGNVMFGLSVFTIVWGWFAWKFFAANYLSLTNIFFVIGWVTILGSLYLPNVD